MSNQVVTAQDNRIRIADNWQGSPESTTLNPRWYPEGYLEKLSATPDNYKAQVPTDELVTTQDSPPPISTSAEPLVHGDGVCCPGHSTSPSKEYSNRIFHVFASS